MKNMQTFTTQKGKIYERRRGEIIYSGVYFRYEPAQNIREAISLKAAHLVNTLREGTFTVNLKRTFFVRAVAR